MALTIGPLTNFGLLFPVVVLFLCLAKLYRGRPIRDKGKAESITAQLLVVLIDAYLFQLVLASSGNREGHPPCCDVEGVF